MVASTVFLSDWSARTDPAFISQTMPPESIARAYKFLYDQDRSTYTAELDVR